MKGREGIQELETNYLLLLLPPRPYSEVARGAGAGARAGARARAGVGSLSEDRGAPSNVERESLENHCPPANNPLTRSILATAPSSLSSLFLFSRSRLSSISTRSSSFARAFLSAATISLACWKSCALNSSNSPFAWDSFPSACCRSACSLHSASFSSVALFGSVPCVVAVVAVVEFERRVDDRKEEKRLCIAPPPALLLSMLFPAAWCPERVFGEGEEGRAPDPFMDGF